LDASICLQGQDIKAILLYFFIIFLCFL